MKLSEMTNDQACEAIIKLTQPVANITDDEAFDPILKELASYAGKPVNGLKILSAMLPKVVPLLLRSHKKDVYVIISVLSGKSEAEIGQMKMTETITILKESIDEDLIGFFRSSVRQTAN